MTWQHTLPQIQRPEGIIKPFLIPKKGLNITNNYITTKEIRRKWRQQWRKGGRRWAKVCARRSNKTPLRVVNGRLHARDNFITHYTHSIYQAHIHDDPGALFVSIVKLKDERLHVRGNLPHTFKTSNSPHTWRSRIRVQAGTPPQATGTGNRS